MGNAFKKPDENIKNTSSKLSDYGKEPRIFNFSSISTSTSFFSNWSFRSTRTNFSESSVRYSKTKWPRPSNLIIFSSHFKLPSKGSKFILENEVAQGSFGKVSKVRNQDTNKSYAMKVLKKSLIIQENCVQQIKTEVDIQRICGHHPFIVNFVDCWQDKFNIYILSEYIPNGELFIKICDFSFELIKIYVAEISLALEFLHNAGIIYRDLKPENILLSSNFHIKLIDFGLSKWLSLGSRTKTICGTLQYMAPEILREEYYDHAVDWWSLGVLTCRMFTNHYPDVRNILNKELCNERKIGNFEQSIDFFPENFDNIPKEAKDLLKRLLEINPRNRINSILKLKRISFFKDFNFELEAIYQSMIKILNNHQGSLHETPEIFL